jgi:cardiolipin synthase A/B
MTQHASTSGNQVQLLGGSRAFFPALISAIDAAVAEVRLETYIFDMTAGGHGVAEALERAAERGVLVQVLVDGVGSPPLTPDWQARMDAAGVHWQVFAPLGTLGMLRPTHWRRLHRKLVCIDRKVAFCGGINILDDFYDPNHGNLTAPRFDFSVRVTGPLVAEVHQAMLQLWARVQRTARLKSGGLQDRYKAMVEASRHAHSVLLDTVKRTPASNLPGAHRSKAALVLRDNVLNRVGIERAYRRAISHAHHEVIIANAYFVPGRKLRLALTHAARRGVKVRLLLQGKYEYFMQYYAARPVYGALLKAGVEIHEYSASFLHAKVAVIDGEWATVGSSNLDPLSLLLAREANVMAHSKTFAAELRAELMQAIEQGGQAMDPQAFADRPLGQRLKEYVAYVAMRAALLLQGRKYL